MTPPELAGSGSRIFGDRFPYPFDGKTVLFEIATQFANEFNTEAKKQLKVNYGWERASHFRDLVITSAYPTSPQQVPRIVIRRTGTSPKPSGIGLEIDELTVELEGDRRAVRKIAGQTITETLEVSLCTINENLRDDLFIWFQQYVIDASLWLTPQLSAVGFYGLQCTNAVDDQVEYQGTQGQPGFEFYVAQLNYQATYDLTIWTDVDELKTIINWEKIANTPGYYAGIQGDTEGYDNAESLNPPKAVFDNASTDTTPDL